MKGAIISFFSRLTIMSILFFLLGCGSTPVEKSQQNTETQNIETAEEQAARFQEIFEQDMQLLQQRRQLNGKITANDIDEILKPREMLGTEATKFISSAEPGKPFYFKIRAIYKGYDKKSKNIILEDTSKTASQENELLAKAFGFDAEIYTIYSSDEPTGFKESNVLATFYCVGWRLVEKGDSQYILRRIWIDEEDAITLFDKSKFIVASGMSYISPSSISIPTQEDVMMNMFTGGVSGNNSARIFDPIKYLLVDLMDARVAMDKKDIRNDYTFPRIAVKYVSEVIFRGQSNTTVTVSTDDNVLTERMNFTGRASSVSNGQKIRVYFTIVKDPLEKWEIQAIEHL